MYQSENFVIVQYLEEENVLYRYKNGSSLSELENIISEKRELYGNDVSLAIIENNVEFINDKNSEFDCDYIYPSNPSINYKSKTY